jgi:hypothetical protein
MFKLRSSALAVALSFTALSAFAAVPTPQLTATAVAVPTSAVSTNSAFATAASAIAVSTTDAPAAATATPTQAASTAGAVEIADQVIPYAFTKLDIQHDPSSCGGIPAPRLTAVDGYRTLCVNGTLRFVSNADEYTYKVTVWNTEGGKKTLKDRFDLVAPYGMPVQFTSATETPYLKSATLDSATGKYSMTTGRVSAGFTVILDAKGRTADGSLLVDTVFQKQDLLSIHKITGADNLDVQTPDTRFDSTQSSIRLPVGKTFSIGGGDGVEVDVQANHIAN